MRRQNVAKINLVITKCQDCPYVWKPEGYADWHCKYFMKTPGLSVNERTVPSWCPFVLKRLEKAIEVMDGGTAGTVPKKWINQIERKQKDCPDPKFGADHAWVHIRNVIGYGGEFLDECVGFGILSNNEVQRLRLMLKIAATLHDVGLAETNVNHEIYSAEMARRYLSSKVDIDGEDIEEICHAICNHSKGHETRNFLDAALLLGDKMDVCSGRMIRETRPIIKELKKVKKTEYGLTGRLGEPEGAELRYYTDGTGFDVSKLSYWEKAILIPMRLSLGFLELKEFRFLVDEKEVDCSFLVK